MIDTKDTEYVISASVAMCPKCSAAVKKILMPEHIIYKCTECNTSFLVISEGQAEHEMLCKEIVYERSKI